MSNSHFSRFVAGGSAEVIVAVADAMVPSAPFVLSANTVILNHFDERRREMRFAIERDVCIQISKSFHF